MGGPPWIALELDSFGSPLHHTPVHQAHSNLQLSPGLASHGRTNNSLTGLTTPPARRSSLLTYTSCPGWSPWPPGIPSSPRKIRLHLPLGGFARAVSRTALRRHRARGPETRLVFASRCYKPASMPSQQGEQNLPYPTVSSHRAFGEAACRGLLVHESLAALDWLTERIITVVQRLRARVFQLLTTSIIGSAAPVRGLAQAYVQCSRTVRAYRVSGPTVSRSLSRAGVSPTVEMR
ncbi:uncharacterized protein B0I36DRAFT_15154 [Microdochium trichocladiopsis]|uniref:Uncharacterized protein n=1 Tax=Microdochium trichocladiopsis TaxID=1682393 RepID=A0A9P9C050_9PEZI|nr:uncharacterized protein B0I36DRAFT_15154 [Microdochium trichocladiopsis]KAH7040769.1 hypothetical protein B0I36DRAFT_15154 [Microdochium trichocladiopsis]